LTGADLVEDKIPIDLPRHFIRRALLVREGVAGRRHPGWLPILNRVSDAEPFRIDFAIAIGYSGFDSALCRNLEAKWHFSQENATSHELQMARCESKPL
jgi:hypothetical protein